MMPEIRACRAEDFDAVAHLLHQLWPDKQLDLARLRTVFDRAITSDSQVYLCATIGRDVVGFGSLTLKNNLWHEGYLGHIDELVVDSKYRSQGIGTRLLAYIEITARRRGCRRIELESSTQRTRAHKFYEQHGFASRALLFSKAI